MLMKRLFFIILLLCFSILQPIRPNVLAISEPKVTGITLKWLGNAGWEIQTGQTVILIDPFLTRGCVFRSIPAGRFEHSGHPFRTIPATPVGVKSMS
jgi:hypothetical protein